MHFLIYEGLDVGLAREHLHAGARGVDFLRASWTGDEEEDLEDVAAARHGEDLCHPGADPFKMFRGLNDPDESETAGGGGPVGVLGDDFTDMGDLMADTNAGGP